MLSDKQHLKTVIITGGGSGIGYEISKLLLESGSYRVVLLGKDRTKLEAAADSLGGHSGVLSVYSCDLQNSSQIERTIERIIGSHIGIYGLVNNAGVYPQGGLSDTTESMWDEAMAVNLRAPFTLIRLVADAMSKNPEGGRVVNISSTAGIHPQGSALAYSVSKAGLIHLSQSLAKELGKNNVTINCVCPGVVRSPLHENYHSSQSELEEFYARRGASLPLGRIGEPRDVAGVVRFFLSDEASWITGDVCIVDGGRLAS